MGRNEPSPWILADGQILPIAQHPRLHAAIGNSFGGDGATTFALPNLENARPLPNTQYLICTDERRRSDGGESNYLGEILLWAGTTPPPGWQFAQGQVLEIDRNQALFTVVGPTFGGDGRTTYALPDLVNRSPADGVNYIISERGVFPINSIESYIAETVILPNQFFPSSTMVVARAQVLQIDRDFLLFAAIGSSFGGDGRTTFALPNLEAHVPFPQLNFLITYRGVFPIDRDRQFP